MADEIQLVADEGSDRSMACPLPFLLYSLRRRLGPNDPTLLANFFFAWGGGKCSYQKGFQALATDSRAGERQYLPNLSFTQPINGGELLRVSQHQWFSGDHDLGPPKRRSFLR